MDGIFIRKKMNIWLVLLLLCGIFFVVLYVFLAIVDADATSELRTFLIMGILCGLVAILSMLLNHGAYIHVGENRIQAKYHWFGKLDCPIDAVEFVLPQINTLTILLKNGKRHVIMGVENTWALGSAMRRQGFALEKESPDSLRQKLSLAQAARKKAFWWVLGGIGLMFANIFLAVLLTGGRDLGAFSRVDWILFSVMGGVELLTIIGLFYVARRCGRYLLPIEQLKYRLRGAIVVTQPLPSDTITAVYTDENYWGRIAVCGFPNDGSVFYCVEEMDGNFVLTTADVSKIYESTDDLPQEDFSAFIEITDQLSINKNSR